jgi:hypothetical protein
MATAEIWEQAKSISRFREVLPQVSAASCWVCGFGSKELSLEMVFTFLYHILFSLYLHRHT